MTLRPAGARAAARSLLIIVVMMLVLSACREQPSKTLRFGLANMPVTLDPRFATDAASSRINRLLYQRLVDFDAHYQPVPSLASWERLSATHYRFHIKRPGHFSDGRELTAMDVKASYDFVLDPRHASPLRISLANIQRIQTPDKETIDFYLARADALFPGRLGLGILPQALIAQQHAFNRHPVGSGPFEFLAWPEEGRLRLRRRRDGQLITFLGVHDPTVRVLKLLRGEIDMLENDIPPELISYLRRQHDIQVMSTPGSNFAYLGFNMKDPVVGKLAVRRAIAHALDRRAIIKYVMGGAGRLAVTLLPPDHWASDPALQPSAYDPDAARTLLSEAGYSRDNPVHISYKTSSDPFRLRLATIIQQQLAVVGIEVELKSYDWGTFYGDIKAGRFQMFSLMWVGIKLPDIYRYVFHSTSVPPAGANRGRFDSQEVDRLIDEAEAGTTLQEQARRYQKLQAVLQQQLPYVPLWYEDHVFVARRKISAYRIAKDGNYDGLVSVKSSAGKAE